MQECCLARFIAVSFVLLALVERSCGEPLPDGVKVSNPTVYRITMTTTFVVPNDNNKIEQLRVYHALPVLRPWSETKEKFGANELAFEPKSTRADFHAPKNSHYLLWAVTKKQLPGASHIFTTTMTIRSVDRDFDGKAAKVAWKDYVKQPKDRTAVVNKEIAKAINPELAKVAAKFKAELSPPEAVQAMCKWVVDNIKYDASFPFPSTDVASAVSKKSGHCGHQYGVLEHLATHAGIPIRVARGMNLYSPDGRKGPMQQIRADFTNIHVWAEVYFPGVGWVELDPQLGEKAFQVPACLIQNNHWFQNYIIVMREGGVEKQPTWTAERGKFRSDYGVENIIGYTEKKEK